jgi:hypothetical protein
MQRINIEFEWVRFADYGVKLRPPAPEFAPGSSLVAEATARVLIPLGPEEAALKTKPLELFPELYLELAEAKPTEEGHKEFALKYGLLTDPYEDYTYEWPRLVTNMQNLVKMVANENWDVRDGRYVPYDLPMKVTLRFGPNNNRSTGMSLGIVPANLYQALILQCVSNRATGAEVRPCKACGALFEIGRPSGHRSNRAFCSDRCRFEFNHRNRGKTR